MAQQFNPCKLPGGCNDGWVT